MAQQPVFFPPSRRYRLYFDETGNGDLHAAKKDENQRYLSLTGIVYRQDKHDTEITNMLGDFKADIFGEDNRQVILHRREIMDRKGVFTMLEDESLRTRFDASFLNLIESSPGPAFTVSIDKLAHLEKYKVWQFSPYHYALTCLVERFVLWLNRNGYVGDVVGEARGPKHDGQLRRSFRRFYNYGTSVRKDIVQKRLTSHDIKLHVKTENIAGLQISDLLAHPCHRAFKFETLGIVQPDDYGSKLAKCTYNLYDRSWYGKVSGYGRKWLP